MMTKMYTKLIENISPLIFISILLVASFAITADDSENVEEIIVKGNVLYADGTALSVTFNTTKL